MAITGDCKSPAVRLRRFESYFQHQCYEKHPRNGVLFFVLTVVAFVVANLCKIDDGKNKEYEVPEKAKDQVDDYNYTRKLW